MWHMKHVKVSHTEKKKFQPWGKKKKRFPPYMYKKILHFLKSPPHPHHFSNGPFPQGFVTRFSVAGTRDEPPRTSAWEADSEGAVKKELHVRESLFQKTRYKRKLSFSDQWFCLCKGTICLM